MLNILISDIFGLTKPLKELSLSLRGENLIIDPYNKEMLNFSSEDQAYQYFSKNVGIEKYSKHVANQISVLKSSYRVMAFSVGASSYWLQSNQSLNSNFQAAYLFYGSQIRNYMAVNPKHPLTLILPHSEVHFSIEGLKNELSSKENINIIHSSKLHGFMNKLSFNFSESEYDIWLATLNKNHLTSQGAGST